ncbi:MAG: 1,4-alpha-glucan branching enzyme [Thermoleophilaceae bacterium]|nr:1,4-alpha-glucan branching enzyme [Thermoleophilaceae bacterium]
MVLHSHMPYVEGYGTWPFGEEWLWEAIATAYLPLLRVLPGAPVTIGLTPVLCDQLEALTGPPGDRFTGFMTGIREQTHREDSEGAERTGRPDLAAEIRRAAGDYVRADQEFRGLGGDLLAAFRALSDNGPAELWAGPATHPVLPLLATTAGLHMQLATGIASHDRRFGRHPAGMWLPECAYEPGLERDLAEHGVDVFCVDQTDSLGLGALDNLEPVRTAAGPVAVPIDWQTISLVWDEQAGYPTAGDYRDSHQRTTFDLLPWANTGQCYDQDLGLAQANAHARDFVQRSIERLDAYRQERGRPGLLCCALDAELLGHWWYEGPHWLETVVAEAGAQGLRLAPISDALEGMEPVERPLAASTWGHPKDMSTWDSPQVADLAFATRRAELRVTRAAQGLAAAPAESRAARHDTIERAARELMALQASDWAFQITRGTASDYPDTRAAGHLAELDAALAALEDSTDGLPGPEVRNIAPDLELSPLIVP